MIDREPVCAQCGGKKSEHLYRHPFVGVDAPERLPAKVVRKSSAGLDYCRATVDLDTGIVSMRYQWRGSHIIGGDMYDGNVLGWSDEEVRELVASIAGIEAADIKRIEVKWE
jgi:hypothetical protein